MRCEELVRRISRWADSGEDPTTDSELAGHLSACPDCHRRWLELRDAESILASAPLAAPPDGFGQRVMLGVAAERIRLVTLQNPAHRSPRVAVVAAVVALAVVATGIVLVGTILAWNLDALPSLAAHNLVLTIVEFLSLLVSVDALVRAVAVLWRALPAPASVVVLCVASFGAFAAASGWAWLVSRYGWAVRQTGA